MSTMPQQTMFECQAVSFPYTPTIFAGDVERISLVELSPAASSISKRAIDIIGAAAGLLLLAPVMLLVALMVRLDTRGPILFRQVRMGHGGRTFRFLKFRTMVVDAESR